jgi:hypothetical protein
MKISGGSLTSRMRVPASRISCCSLPRSMPIRSTTMSALFIAATAALLPVRLVAPAWPVVSPAMRAAAAADSPSSRLAMRAPSIVAAARPAATCSGFE